MRVQSRRSSSYYNYNYTRVWGCGWTVGPALHSLIEAALRTFGVGMEVLGGLLVALAAALAVLTAVNASPMQRRDLPRLVELTARRLGELREVPLRTTEEEGGGGVSGLTCDACKVIVDTLDTLYMENRTRDDIVAAITELCIELQIEDRNVCTLAIKEFEVMQHSATFADHFHRCLVSSTWLKSQSIRNLASHTLR